MNAAPDQTLRLDLLLWYLRLARSRSLAKSMAQSGRLRCNGRRIVKGHHQIGVGDVLTLMLGRQVAVLRLDSLPQRRGSAAQAQQHYSHLVNQDGRAIVPNRENVSV